jgi:hypothetical protein
MNCLSRLARKIGKTVLKDPDNSICCELSDVQCIAEYSRSLEDWNEL